MEATKKFSTPIGDVTLKGGIMYVYQYPMEATLEQAKQHIAMLKEELKDYLPLPALINIKDMKTSKKEVRDYMSGDELNSMIIATALITGSGLSKILGNLFLSFSKPQFPTKLFSEEEKAAEWLQQYIK
jgi:hypothetical protein